MGRVRGGAPVSDIEWLVYFAVGMILGALAMAAFLDW